MKYVIYMGVFFMPNGNAAAHRATAFVRMIKELGYVPVIIGMEREFCISDVLETKNIHDGVHYYSINYPKNTMEWFKILYDIKGIKQIVTSLGVENVQAIIAMDYFSVALYRLIKYCRNNNIRFIADTVDWFTKSNYPFPKNLIKDIDTKIRMQYFHKKVTHMITISKYLKKYYSNSVKNIVQIPGVYNNEVSGRIYEGNNLLRFCFVGSPGVMCEKEKIDWMIKAILSINQIEKKVEFIVAGIDKETLVCNRPDITSLTGFDESIECLGRLSHDECLQLISKSDFSVIIREDNLLSKAGFPTKLGESFACGTPVFVTPTSDIVDFIPKGYGVVTSDCTSESVLEAVKELIEIPKERIIEMHGIVRSGNPLDCMRFIDEMKEIIG